jgi:hypothetical protein
MTAPREILPGRCYLITRRATQRQFLLRPDPRTNAIFAYCLGEAATRYEIDLIAWVAMSNHYHAVVHDRHGRLPAFLEHFHKMMARCLNARWGRWENFWSCEQTCVTYLPTPEAVFDKVIYVLANPVAGHLVDRVIDWPGCISLHHLDGRRTSHKRPKEFFRPDGSMRESAVLYATQPPCSASRESAAEWAERVRVAVAKAEASAREERRATGRGVVGRKAVLRASAFDSPETSEPRRNLRPALACKDEKRRAAELVKLMQFRIAYHAARQRFVAGDHSVEFPAGTYRIRAWGARCAPVPLAA